MFTCHVSADASFTLYGLASTSECNWLQPGRGLFPFLRSGARCRLYACVSTSSCRWMVPPWAIHLPHNSERSLESMPLRQLQGVNECGRVAWFNCHTTGGTMSIRRFCDDVGVWLNGAISDCLFVTWLWARLRLQISLSTSECKWIEPTDTVQLPHGYIDGFNAVAQCLRRTMSEQNRRREFSCHIPVGMVST